MSGKLMGRVYHEFGGTRPQQHVLLAYAEAADDDGTNCRPGIARIAYETNLEVRRVKQVTAELRAAKVLKLVREASGRRPAEYEIHLEEGKQKESFEEWKAARGLLVEVQPVPPLREPVEVQLESVEVQETPPLEDGEGCNLKSVGVQSRDGGVQFEVRRGAVATTQPLHPSYNPSYNPSEGAGAREGPPTPEAPPPTPEGELRYLNDQVRQTVEVLESIKRWEKDRPATIALVSATVETYPADGVLATAKTLAYKIRVGACKDYSKPSKAFSNWAASDEARREEREERGSGRRSNDGADRQSAAGITEGFEFLFGDA